MGAGLLATSWEESSRRHNGIFCIFVPQQTLQTKQEPTHRASSGTTRTCQLITSSQSSTVSAPPRGRPTVQLWWSRVMLSSGCVLLCLVWMSCCWWWWAPSSGGSGIHKGHGDVPGACRGRQALVVVGEAARVHEGPSFAGGLDGAVVAEEPAAAALQARHSSTTLVLLGLLAFKSHHHQAWLFHTVAMVTCCFSNNLTHYFNWYSRKYGCNNLKRPMTILLLMN